MDLKSYGWDRYNQQTALGKVDFLVGRIAIENKSNYTVLTEFGECQGILRGKFLSGHSELPRVGDWVRITKLPNEDKVAVEEVLPRATKISRKSAHDEEEQVIVANIDVVFIVQGLPDDFNLRRLERYLVIARQSGAKPVVILNKIDLNADYLEQVDQAKAVSLDAEVIAMSSKTGQGIDVLKNMIEPGLSFVFLGSSGVGKSSLINSLTGLDLQSIQEIRDSDGRGRHTTTRREMIFLDNGGILIDTPGMRELGIWNETQQIDKTFIDIEELSWLCKFSRCDHDKSAGCAVKAALEAGTLDPKRFQSYMKLKREQEFSESKTDKAKALERRTQAKTQQKALNNKLKQKYSKR